MPNPENLISFRDMPEEKRKAIASKGGKMKGENFRKRKSMKLILDVLLDKKLPEGNKKAKLKELGVKSKDLNNQTMMLANLIEVAQGTTRNNVKAAELIMTVMGELNANDNQQVSGDNTTHQATLDALQQRNIPELEGDVDGE